MQPTFTPPIPVIGNHPAGCSCSTCAGGRKRLLASPYVQRLIANLTEYHSLVWKATEKQHSAPTSELEKCVLTLTDQLSTSQKDIGVLTQALDQSRKISQEQEKHLAEEKRLHKLSKMSDANARGLLQQIRDEIGGDQDEPALEKVRRMKDEVISRGVACEWNAAEGVRLAESLRDSQEAAIALQQDLTASQESLRLAEQGRDKALAIIDDCRTMLLSYIGGAALDSPLTPLVATAASAMARLNCAEGELHVACSIGDKRTAERDAVIAELDELSENHEAVLKRLCEQRTEIDILTPLLPLWARIAFAGVVFFLVAYLAHQAGFNAAMTLQGGAR
jgi:hypothetical protein